MNSCLNIVCKYIFLPLFLQVTENRIETHMKIKVLAVGITSESYLKEGMEHYIQRMKHYTRFEWQELRKSKSKGNLSRKDQNKKEEALIMNALQPRDFVVLLDDGGRHYSSESFAGFIQKRMNQGLNQLVFVVGGAYGFSEALYNRADALVSLSKMTFSHQLVRILFLEQLYRAFTILNNEPYHHA